MLPTNRKTVLFIHQFPYIVDNKFWQNDEPDMIQILQVHTPDQLIEIKKLFREYETWLGFDLSFQNFEKEVSSLPGKYTPPKGAILMASFNEHIAGCIAVRPLDKDICEMKRFFVRSKFRGYGIGKKLSEAIVEKAKEIGYAKIRLDTHNTFKAAIGIYRKLGFKEIDSYYHNPMPDVSYWELDLT
jgi:putative acetyltransferase